MSLLLPFQCASMSLKVGEMLSECQTTWIWIRSKLFASGTIVVLGGLRVNLWTAPNCIKDFLDLPDDSGKSGLTLQLFPMLILANQV